jgi:toxin ParE1/3/4
VCGLLIKEAIGSTGPGRARREIQPEARSIVIERWLALYCIAEDGAQVMRITDGARDLPAIE